MPFLDWKVGRPPLYSCGPDAVGENVLRRITSMWRQRDQGHDWVAVSVSGESIEAAVAAGDGKKIYTTSRPLEIHTLPNTADIRWPLGAVWDRHECESPLDARRIPPALRKAVVNWLKYGTPEPEGGD